MTASCSLGDFATATAREVRRWVSAGTALGRTSPLWRQEKLILINGEEKNFPKLEKIAASQQKGLALSFFLPIIQTMLHCNIKAQVAKFGAVNLFFLTFGVFFMLTVEQVMASHKSNVETIFGLTHKAFEGVEKLVELNLTASKAALSEASNHTQTMMSVKDAQELLALQSGLLQPLAEKTAAYSRHLYEIATGAGTEFTKSMEAQAADAQQKLAALVDSAAQNAPAGSESAVAVIKSAVSAAHSALESVQKAVKQATDVAEANFNAVAATASNATKQATTAAKKR